MRVTYILPSSAHFDEVFTSPLLRGGGIHDIKIYKPNYHSRGGSLFGILGGLIRKSLPFIKSIIAPEFGNFMKNVVEDVDNNVPLKSSVRKNIIKSSRNVGKRIIRGGGGSKKQIKRKKINNKRKSNKKKSKGKKNMKNDKYHSDIFTINRYEF